MRSAWFASTVAVVSLVVFGCAPDQPAATGSCDKLSDCALGMVCDRAKGACIDEPTERFLGRYTCTIQASGDTSADVKAINVGEVIGRIRLNRWAFPIVYCTLNEAKDRLLVELSPLSIADSAFDITLTASKARSGRVDLGLDAETGFDSAEMASTSAALVYGSSISGYVEATGTIAVGSTISGYVDVTMLSTERHAKFGDPCAHGRADCGETSSDIGGVSKCKNIRLKDPTPICTLSCKSNSDCAQLAGVCLAGNCLEPCQTSADCTAPAQCGSGPDPTLGMGCY